MSLNILNSENFFAFSGISKDDTNLSYLNFLIDQLNGMIDEELEPIFSFNTFEADYYAKGNRSVIVVGAWQPANRVVSITVDMAGSGYSISPTITFLGGTPKVVTKAIAIVKDETITAIKIIDPGDGYTSTPTITITDTSGIGATATAILSILTVTSKTDGGDSFSQDLIDRSDIKFLFLRGVHRRPTQSSAIGGVLIYSGNLLTGSYLRLSGTYGVAEVIPSSLMLEGFMYDLLKKAIMSADNETTSGGSGTIKSTKIKDVSITFGPASNDNSRGEILTTKDALDIAKGFIDGIVRRYEYKDSDSISIIG